MDEKMPTTFAALTIGVLGALLLTKTVTVLYDVFLTPLRRVPGPWHASFTGLVAQINIINKRQVHHYHDLHRQYGPIVRIGPREVIVADLPAFREIHRMGTRFRKSDFYKFLNPTEAGKGPYALFAQVDPVQHAAHRKLLARGFSLHSLRSEWEETVRQKVQTAVQKMKAEAAASSDGEVDVLKWGMLMAADIVSKLMFGESFDMLQTGKRDPYFDAIAENESVGALAWTFPWLYRILRWLPIPSVRDKFSSYRQIFDKGQQAVINSRGSAHNRNIFAKVFAQADKGDCVMTDHEIIVNAAAFILAGTDTTATTFAYLIWAVLQQPTLQSSLEAEVARLDDAFTDDTLSQLPILNAVIQEALRLYGAAPGGLPRITPPGGAMLAGYHIPDGTTVSTQAWTLHRNPSVFEHADEFDHTRWLDSAHSAPFSKDDDQADGMTSAGTSSTATAASAALPAENLATAASSKIGFAPYGAGSRNCIGVHLANMELRMAAARFFRDCAGAVLAPSTTPESMEVENVFLVSPKGHACKVVLR